MGFTTLLVSARILKAVRGFVAYFKYSFSGSRLPEDFKSNDGHSNIFWWLNGHKSEAVRDRLKAYLRPYLSSTHSRA
ncbi:unnamed protein product [Heterobilharzia americana]|nr:unnamed protein product [Heterobilharzia americana]